jgi:hypothetical protein
MIPPGYFVLAVYGVVVSPNLVMFLVVIHIYLEK